MDDDRLNAIGASPASVQGEQGSATELDPLKAIELDRYQRGKTAAAQPAGLLNTVLRPARAVPPGAQ